MKVRYLSLAVLVLAALVTASIVSAEWTYELSYTVPYTDYGIDTAVMVGNEILVGASNTSTQEDAAVFVLDVNLSEVASYNITSQADTIAAIDARGDLIAVGAIYGNTTIFVINRTEGSVYGPALIESAGGTGFSAQVEKLALSGEYIYALVYDNFDMNYYLYILDKTPSVVTSEPVGMMADIARVENSDYLLYWNGSNLIYIVDGTAGSLNVVDSIDVGTAVVRAVAGYYNDTENAIYVVYGSDMGTYLVKYVIGTGIEYSTQIGTEADLVPTFVAAIPNGLYVVTENGYGYRVTNLTSPTAEVEAIPTYAFGYYYGSEYIYALYQNEIRRFALEVAAVTTTQTVTETQLVYETETETVTETTTVEGPYTTTDLAIVGIVCLLLGAAIAYVVRKR